jgi:hypothetical protein
MQQIPLRNKLFVDDQLLYEKLVIIQDSVKELKNEMHDKFDDIDKKLELVTRHDERIINLQRFVWGGMFTGIGTFIVGVLIAVVSHIF